MIPYKLRLQNFLSYREDLEPLEFSGMHLVCLTGQNGHGKSALLDAVTWALWGKARSTSDDDLMHAGSDEMQVEFEFDLGDQRYNVIRKRLAAGRSKKSELELAVWEEGAAAWRPLTEPSIRATQAKINDLLRMDYETFVNSAFLKQGEADAFTSKSPGQRKDILATILNLSQYDAYSEHAKGLAKEAEGEEALIAARVQEIDQELAERPQYEEDLRRATLSESQARLRRGEAEQAAAEARLQVQDLANKRSTHEDLARRLQRAEREHGETGQQLGAARARLQGLEALLAERQAIEDGYAALLAAREEEAAWSERLHARRPLEQEQQRLTGAWRDAKAQVERELALAQRELVEAEKRAGSLATLTGDEAGVREKIEALAAQQAEAQAARERLAELAASRQHWQNEKQRVEDEGRKLRERLDMLRSGETEDCPVCKRPLNEHGRDNLETEYEQQLQSLREQLRTCNEKLREIAGQEQETQTALAGAERELRVLPSLQRQLAELESALAQAQAAADVLPALQTRVEELAEQLQSGSFAPELAVNLAALAAQIEALAYDEPAHQRARATISDLSGVERKHIELEEALKQIEGVRQQVEGLRERQQREAQTLADDRARLEQLVGELQAQDEAEAHLRQQLAAADQARADWERARGQVIAAQQRLQTCDTLAETRRERMRALTDAKERGARFRHLQEAFGPRGVQAMIIEAALPELESEANHLLGRLSDGRMSVRLDTQRELKSGGVRETLDIIISDELGSRPYELYSGGEAFRADLALRIALSRLLAHRAGAALQTLFIDEGFGTQDAQGRENLIDALHMIKDEFALVLVITHIDELKEHFPVRIQVVKEDGTGSRYTVL